MNISVIIPLYNAIEKIKNTIESVIKQTYSDSIEIIVVNDGSTDGCEKIVKDMILDNQTNRVIKLINKPNGGVSTARNRGIKECRGEYIAFLDADDAWHPQKLELMMQCFENDEVDVVGHAYTINNNFEQKYSKTDMQKVSFLSLLFKNFAVTPSVILKKSIFQSFDESMRYAEDHELWLRMSYSHNFYFVNLPLVLLGRKPLTQGGLSAQRWNMRKGEMKMYMKSVKYNKLLIFILPFLVAFSLLKHGRRALKDYFDRY